MHETTTYVHLYKYIRGLFLELSRSFPIDLR